MAHAGASFAAVKPALALLADEHPVLQQLISSAATANLTIDHALESPDTLVDDCALLQPLIDIIKNQVLTNSSTTQKVIDSANNDVLPVRVAATL